MKQVLKILLVLAFILWLVLIALAINNNKASSETTVVDQGTCQYTDRFYPDGSCNNSDPCDPETLKDPVLKGDCRPVEPAVIPEQTKAEVIPTQSKECEGK